MPHSSRLLIFAVSVLLVGLLVYLSGTDGPFFFDDRPALIENELVQIDGTVVDEWRTAALSSNSGLLRRPVSMLSFTAQHVLAGDFSAVVLKAGNLTIHLAIAALLYFFSYAVLDALAIGRDRPTRQLIAVTAAAIWLLHPLHVSTVLYTVQRMAQLATLFVLVGLLTFMRYRQRWAEHGAPPGELLAAALWLLLLTVFAALSKENGALLPWLIIVLEVTIFRGVWAAAKNHYLHWLGWTLLVLPVMLILLVLALSPETLVGGYSGREFSLEQRLLTQLRLLWRYLGWLCFPNINDMGFQHDDIPLSGGLLQPLSTAFALAGWLLALGLAFRFRLRYPLILLSLLFYLVGHSMESSVWPLEMVYEHRNYLPSMMICLVIAVLLVVPVTQSKRVGVGYPILGALFILCFLLFIRVQSWSDELTLSRVNLVQHPESSRSNYFYANALLRRYRRSEQFGLNEQDRSELLLLSRHYFERMYQTNDRDVAALVMLYCLDSQYYPALLDQADWLSELEALLETRTLQPSDWNSLDTLMDCFAASPDAASETQVLALLDKLAARYPLVEDIFRFRYRYLAAAGVEPGELLPLLLRAQELAPQTTWVHHYLLLEYARMQDLANLYEQARLWLLHDPRRYHLHQLKSLFTAGESTAELSRD
jgi:protein O-mannosyl-transferase